MESWRRCGINKLVPEIIFKASARARSIRITIDGRGQVVATYPKWTPQFVVKKYVQSQSAWIEANLAKVKTKKALSDDDQTVVIFGKKYRKDLVNSLDFPYGVSLGDQVVRVNLMGGEKKTHQELLNRFLKNTAEKYIVPRTHALGKTMSLEFRSISLRQQKTRWGSCSSQKRLNFNWRLVHYLPKIIDYVIIHELSHLQEMNHSARFWELVRRYDPEYQIHRGFLKRSGMALG